jgi:hypothetical protein
MRFNASSCDVIPEAYTQLNVEATVTSFNPSSSNSQANFSGDLDIFNIDGEMEIQIEGLTVQGLASSTDSRDREFFLQTVYKRDPWTGFNGTEGPIQSKVDVDLDALCVEISSLVTATPSSLISFDRVEKTLDLALSASSYKHHLELLKACSRAMPAILPGLINEIKQESLEIAHLTGRLVQVIEDITHRHPHISVLEINLGSMLPLTEVIHEGLAPANSSFTTASVSASISMLPEQSPSDNHSILHLEEGNILAGLDETIGRFDLVVLCGHNDAIATHDIRMHVLQNLLRPGAFLVSVESNGQLLQDRLSRLLRNHTSSGSVTPISSINSAEIVEGRYASPHVLLQSKEIGVSLSIEQARDATVDILRSPLANLKYGDISGAALIVGGKQGETDSIRQRLDSVLTSLGCTTSCVTSLDAVTPQMLSNCRWVVLLADLEQPILENIDSASISGLQALFSPGRSVLWLTNGFYEGRNPLYSASFGLGRTAKGETPKFRLQFLDVDTLTGIEDLVAETFMRFIYSAEHEDEVSAVLWTTEDEIIFSNDQILLPRVKPVDDMNQRLNSKRRTTKHLDNIAQMTVELKLRDTGAHSVYEASAVGADALLLSSDHRGSQKISVAVSHSTVWTVGLSGDVSLFVGVGTIEGSRRELFLSDKCCSNVSTDHSWVQEIGEASELSDGMIVALFIRTMIATRLITVATGGSLTLVDPDDLMISVISSLQPMGQDSRIRYLTADPVRARNDMRLTYIHPQSTKRMVTELIGTGAGVIIDLSDGLKSQIRDLLTGVPLDVTRFFNQTPQLRSTEAVIDSTISTALSSFLSNVAPPKSANLDKLVIRSLNALVDQNPQQYMTLIDWRRDPLVELKIQPLKLDPFLSESKTYLLVGLTGELGESLCRLMASHGARYFVVASR